jgi:hypothetical protein
MTRPLSALSSAVLFAALVVPGVASAGTVVLTPLLSEGADPKVVANVTALISSELDFMSSVEDVIEVARPATLNASCLGSTTCLGGIAKGGGGDQLVTGSMALADGNVTLDLVLFDAATSKTVRRKSFTLPSTSEDLADGMGGVMKELMTGSSAASAAAAEPSVADFEDDESEDFSFDEEDEPSGPLTLAAAPTAAISEEEELGDFDLEDLEGPSEEERAAEVAATRRAEEEARRKAEEDARRLAEEQRRALAEQARVEEQERVAAAAAAAAAAEAARGRAAEQARLQALEAERLAAEAALAAAEEEEEVEFDPSMINFGSASSEIQAEQVEQAPSRAPTPVAASRPAATSRASYDAEEEEELEDLDAEEEDPDEGEDDDAIADLDDEGPSARDSERASSRDDSGSLDRDPDGSGDGPIVVIAARGGYARYYDFDFVTAGGEIAVAIAPSVYLLGGVETYSTQRQVPPLLQLEVGKASQWDTIYPFNFGIAYKVGSGRVKPYVGADMILTQYYFDEDNQASWAVGARARAGADFMIASAFGLNLNVSAGFWHGKDWEIVQKDVKSTGILPQVSLGPLLAF